MRAVVIANPPFVVCSHRRLSQNNVQLQGLNHRVYEFSLAVFAGLKCLGNAFKKASHYVAFYVVFALRITLEIYPMFVAPLATLVKTSMIALVVLWGGMTGVILMGPGVNAIMPNLITTDVDIHPYLVGSRIDPEHFKAVDTKVSIAEVPKSVKLRDFLTVLEQIPTEASEQGQPGYISTPYSAQMQSRQMLRDGLNLVVNNINAEANWVGVPRSFMGRKEFYKNLKDLLFSSFHILTTEYNKFVAEHGIPQTPTEESSEEEKKLYQQYLDLLENKYSFVVDIALAGLTCGGGVMGEALDTYLRLTKGAQTLQNEIDSLLVDRRLKIIRADVEDVARSDPNHAFCSQSRHYFTAYLTKLGASLGIPGSDAAKEHLPLFLNAIKPRMRLVKFFSEYTSEQMIKDVIERYSALENFRILVQEWLKERVGDWNLDKYSGIQTQIISKVETMLRDQRFKTGAHSKVAGVSAWLEYLKNHDQEAWNEIFICRDGVWFVKNDEGETALDENSLHIVLERLFSLSDAQKDWVGQQEPLIHLNTLKELFSHLLEEKHSITVQSEAPLSDLLESITSDKYARDWLLKRFPVGETSNLQELRRKEKETLTRWKEAFSSVESASSGLEASLRQYIIETQQKNPNAQVTWQLAQRIARENRLDAWKQEIAHPEFLAFFEGFLKGDSRNAEAAFIKKVKASNQVKELSQELDTLGGFPIPSEMKQVFIVGMMEETRNHLHQTIESHLQRARRTEFLAGVLTREGEPEGSQSLKEALAEWLLIEHGAFLF